MTGEETEASRGELEIRLPRKSEVYGLFPQLCKVGITAMFHVQCQRQGWGSADSLLSQRAACRMKTLKSQSPLGQVGHADKQALPNSHNLCLSVGVATVLLLRNRYPEQDSKVEATLSGARQAPFISWVTLSNLLNLSELRFSLTGVGGDIYSA